MWEFDSQEKKITFFLNFARKKEPKSGGVNWLPISQFPRTVCMLHGHKFPTYTIHTARFCCTCHFPISTRQHTVTHNRYMPPSDNEGVQDRCLTEVQSFFCNLISCFCFSEFFRFQFLIWDFYCFTSCLHSYRVFGIMRGWEQEASTSEFSQLCWSYFDNLETVIFFSRDFEVMTHSYTLRWWENNSTRILRDVEPNWVFCLPPMAPLGAPPHKPGGGVRSPRPPI